MMTAEQKKMAATVVDYFTSQGYSKEQACGIAGNMYVESRFKIGAVNPKDVNNKQSIGLCQWNGARNEKLRKYAKDSGKDWQNLNVQLGYTSHELRNGEKNTPPILKQTNTPESAALAWAKSFERCSSDSYTARQKAAKEIYNGVTKDNWEAGDLDTTTDSSTGESEKEMEYDTVDNENTNFIDSPSNEYSKASNEASDSKGEFKQLTGYGINWEDDENLIVFEKEPAPSETEQEESKSSLTSVKPGKKPPTLSQKFVSSISISEHSYPAMDADESEQHSISEGSGQNASHYSTVDTFSV